MAGSIALGLSAVRHADADAVLIALADMPFVPTSIFNGCSPATAARAASRLRL
jgi:CTP:molybdopterin cytidylyltransferase MocA